MKKSVALLKVKWVKWFEFRCRTKSKRYTGNFLLKYHTLYSNLRLEITFTESLRRIMVTSFESE